MFFFIFLFNSFTYFAYEFHEQLQTYLKSVQDSAVGKMLTSQSNQREF